MTGLVGEPVVFVDETDRVVVRGAVVVFPVVVFCVVVTALFYKCFYLDSKLT